MRSLPLSFGMRFSRTGGEQLKTIGLDSSALTRVPLADMIALAILRWSGVMKERGPHH